MTRAPAPAQPATDADGNTNVAAEVARLYAETDVPPPSTAYPVAPLGPLLTRLQVRSVELPHLKRRVAEDYLRQRGFLREPFPPDDDHDAELAGFLYASVLLGTSVGGFLFVDSSPAHGGVPGSSITRRRFSVAHELGHLVLHFRPALRQSHECLDRGEYNKPYRFDAFTKGAAEAGEKEAAGASRTSDFPQREHEADAFAAAILMPEDVVRGLHAELRARYPALPEETRVRSLATDLLVSRQAMTRRLRDLGLGDEPGDAWRFEEGAR